MKPVSSFFKTESFLGADTRKAFSFPGSTLYGQIAFWLSRLKKNAKTVSGEILLFFFFITGFCFCFLYSSFFCVCFIPQSKVFIRHFLISLLRAVMFDFFLRFFCRRIQEGNSFSFEFFLIFISPSSFVSDTYAFFRTHSLNCYFLQFH